MGKDYKVHFADRLPNALRPGLAENPPVFSGSSQILGLLASSNWRDNRTAPFIFYTMVIYWVVVSNIFLNVHPYLGKIPILTNIFKGVGNHQPVVILGLRKPSAIVFSFCFQAVIHEFSRDQDGEAFFFHSLPNYSNDTHWHSIGQL